MGSMVGTSSVDIQLYRHDQYELHAYGRHEIEGPLGTPVAHKRYLAKPTWKPTVEGKIHEQLDYYHPESRYENLPYREITRSWQPPEEVLEDEEKFLGRCKDAMTRDPETEYEDALRGTRFGIYEHIDNAEIILIPSATRAGFTGPQGKTYTLRDPQSDERQWLATALGKPKSDLERV